MRLNTQGLGQASEQARKELASRQVCLDCQTLDPRWTAAHRVCCSWRSASYATAADTVPRSGCVPDLEALLYYPCAGVTGVKALLRVHVHMHAGPRNTHLQNRVCVIASQGRAKVQAFFQHVLHRGVAWARGMHCQRAVFARTSTKGVHSADIGGVVSRAVEGHERAVGVGIPRACEQHVIITDQRLCRIGHLQAQASNQRVCAASGFCR